ncbi:nucleoside triphosphate pyrophosphohydrolase [Orenia marismortui]|uniref:Tetrapyrrole methylase family protein/MazG family protein n=1 Tax=Orenia marismortui TaxID=46469 RepID=A0A4R8H812_9FIRM|nr:nucleoside triphosphate pyrophosphohydrolase [Orenia marismortui]TDX51258.1 tetrapyrrole methylase family protein/MazG family protein [Orenia marismortui]
MLQIIGLGAGGLKLLTLEAYKSLKNADVIYLRTEHHPAVKELKEENIEFESFDYLYEQGENFAVVYRNISNKIIDLTKKKKDIIYAVPGHPLVAEDTVQQITNKLSDDEYKVIAGPSFIDAIFTSLEIDPVNGIKVLDGLNFIERDLEPSIATIITQVYNRNIASNVKLTLMEIYPDDFKVKVLRGAGLEDERIEEISLYELDHLPWIDHLTSLYIPAHKENTKQFNRLLEIMEILRSSDGCPWDLEQNHHSLKKHLIEESYEVIERIEKEDFFGLANELGDVLLQIVFHAQIAKEDGTFNIYDVISEVIEKMLRRHPHIFAQVEVENSTEVLENWEAIKKKEKMKQGETRESILDDVPIQLPALIQAQKIQNKASKVGFDWPEVDGAITKVNEEIEELLESIEKGNLDGIKEEFGDLIFSLVNVARFLNIDSEECLRNTINKFKSRFKFIEDKVCEEDQSLEELSLERLDLLWEESKSN